MRKTLVIVVALLIAAGTFLALRQQDNPLPASTDPNIQAAQKLENTLPYRGGSFSISYAQETNEFLVMLKLNNLTWEEYATQRNEAAGFFRKQGIDPCTLTVQWLVDGTHPETFREAAGPIPDDLSLSCS
ncbi:MAG: hypothetical protein A2806_00920 [Candidatus Terrybacteria bacterium RIFCSPHIGHO2_01_FULL_48_17]|uniref:Uncharacterized protein n=1 Tax=Candidatus Terrybacteria bacterium RIFCSPHIGHO2_01_FULL_48_17 TaxID=1802362 RepID=A0A1G2PK19_9BACT|nr:MAG: hypothetical protein A2806_00920 [Candidatus Terrybacteria bacterium RIFCSPHIGHO2_01_FULL_48_17]OHA51881.1 MAG: hypothetical protein A3A30_00935 [Candidatus Terrybacteria bacterium RIFCSPLOWO2_01_FULL_48_14]